ncbi:MAG TPA: hypothetical protein VJ757_06485 [Pseudonocardiaceae bacterium]|nr:hypothetical protein [Pseudonocardiaceae bacterium]
MGADGVQAVIGRPRGRASMTVAGIVALLATLGACGGPSATHGSAPGSAPATSASGPATATNPPAPEVNAAGDIPDSQVFVSYAPPGGAFVVKVPQGWAQSREGSAVVFTDKFNTVRIDSVPRPQAPDVASARAHKVAQLRGSVPGFQPGQVTMVQRPAGPAVLITYQASSAPNAVTGKSVLEAVQRYEFWRGGQEVVLTLSAPQGSDNVDPWRMITDSFRWT